jgi:hypothetical protein
MDRSRIYEAIAYWVHAKIESLERPGTEKNHVAGLAKNDIVGRARSTSIHERRPGPTLEHRSIGLAKSNELSARDLQRIEHLRRTPRQLGTGVDENGPKRVPATWLRGILDLDVDSESPHLAHATPPHSSRRHPILASATHQTQGTRVTAIAFSLISTA